MTPIPQSVVDRAELLARSHPLQTVAELIGVHPSQITRMKRRGWRAADYSSRVRPMPSDFPILHHEMSFGELVDHYRAGNATVARWMRQVSNRRPSWRGRRG